EYNIQVVENDPDFTKTTTTASKYSDPIEVEAAQIRTYLAKDKNAKGRVYYELYRNVDGSNKLIARSGSFDVQKLLTYSSSRLRYTSLYWNVNIPLDLNYAYILKVKCRDCEQSGENTNVYWWRSEIKDDNNPKAGSKKENNEDQDFTYNIIVRKKDGETYNNQYNFKREIATPINNLSIDYGRRFTPANDIDTQRAALTAIYNANPGNTLGWDLNDPNIS